jgi:polar amino acid transport system substrate-binding protein
MRTTWIWLSLALCLGSFQVRADTLQVVTETTPYTYLQGGRVVGAATEVVEKTLALAEFQDYRINLYPWARAYDMALKEPNVLIYLIARTAERERQFKWAGEIMKIDYHLYRLKARNDVVVNTLADARNYRIGVMRDDVRHQYLMSKGFTKLVISAQWRDNFNKLINRQVDIVPLTVDDAQGLCAEAHFDCAALERMLTLDEASTSLYMAYSLATPDSVVDRTRAAFDRLIANGDIAAIMRRRP